MKDPATYSPERTFVHNIVNELNEFQAVPFEPAADIDVVWVVSSVGTVKETADLGPDNPYTGELWDREVVESGIQIVREITALRLGKPVSEVDSADIETAGPTLLYNGETPGLPHSKFPSQNKHFEELINEPGFPIPRDKIVIGELDGANTPAQVRQIAGYLHENGSAQKVAAVCHLPHTTRLGRYIEHHKDLLPEDVSFIAAPVKQTDTRRQSAIATEEIRKAKIYNAKGDLAVRSAFFPDSAPHANPRRAPKTVQETRA